MSSEEIGWDSPAVPAKKRRIQRACDACRHKRRACDGLRMAGKQCTDCVRAKKECVYSGIVVTPQRRSYTQILEARLALTEKLLHKLMEPTHRSTTQEDTVGWSKDSPIFDRPEAAWRASSPPVQGPGVELATLGIRNLNLNNESEPAHSDDVPDVESGNDIEARGVNNYDSRFHGNSSGVHLVQTAAQLKSEYITESGAGGQSRVIWNSRWMKYWTPLPPQVQWGQPAAPLRYTYPPPDVLSALAGLYFENCSIYIPMLHRPTFERAVAENLHLRDDKFGATVLLVCALGSRFSDDPRVFDPAAPLTCGWKYFSQLSMSMIQFFDPPTLYDLQYYGLAIQFLEGCVPHANWSLAGVGLRIAQEAGVHRLQSKQPAVESELWKRAFWVLVFYDRLISATQGRPCALQYEDIDIELPTECDDEYWESEDPELRFRQPPGKPSRVTFFVVLLRLSNIFAFSLRVVYSSRKSKELLALRDEAWEEHLVAELDSALNKWVDSIPGHLRWDPNLEDTVFFRQSVVLYCSYYHVQMTTHRAFIPMIRKAAPTSLPSLAICTNAARSCSHVAEISRKRMGHRPVVYLLPALKTASIILLLNVWSGKRTGLPPHMNTAITEVHKCMAAIRVCEDRWQNAGLVGDILSEFANVGDIPGPSPSPPSGSAPAVARATSNPRKRTQGANDDSRYTQLQDLPPSSGSRVGGDAVPSNSYSVVDEQLLFAWVGDAHQTHALPMYTPDLGKLPLYPQLDASLHTGEAWHQNDRDIDAVEPPAYAPTTSHPLNPVAGHSQLGTSSGADANPLSILIENDALSMWANAPAAFNMGEWGAYFTAMNEHNQDLAYSTTLG
ncbi:fungal-specific transcription factor domain-containing protein [Mycena galericulata]|nr:fungal-specific transcription factor domain-containing protein [Mycena galericulata]